MKDAEFVWVIRGEGVHDCAGVVGGAVVDGNDVEVGILLV